MKTVQSLPRAVGSPAWLTVLLLFLGLGIAKAADPAVVVTASLDDPVLQVGESTTLRIFAQVAPDLQAGSDYIFSWCIDVNAAGAGAVADYPDMDMVSWNNNAGTSSTGQADTPHRRAVRNTNYNPAVSGLGVAAPVELCAIPVTATAAGSVTFTAATGTGPEVPSDFIVAPSGNTGGDYTAAIATLTVEGGAVTLPDPELADPQVQRTPQGASITFTPLPGFDHRVEASSTLEEGSWVPLPGAPHNSGSVEDTAGMTSRFYRVWIGLP